MPLVINNLRADIHTHKPANQWSAQDQFKKTGACQLQKSHVLISLKHEVYEIFYTKMFQIYSTLRKRIYAG